MAARFLPPSCAPARAVPQLIRGGSAYTGALIVVYFVESGPALMNVCGILDESIPDDRRYRHLATGLLIIPREPYREGEH
jgi:hypothetical protein